MSTETGFNTAWLEERFAFDTEARNKQVEQDFLHHFSSKKALNILDLGAGSGSSFLYLAERLPMDQSWTFIELNPELAAAGVRRILKVADQKQWTVRSSPTDIQLSISGRNVSIKVINGSFLELPELVDIKSFDLATAAAVLDLLTPDMLNKLLSVLSVNQIALLATINYAGMSFEPETPMDKYYADLYSQHMQREQVFGKTLGPDCTRAIKAYCRTNDLKVISGESNWIVKPKDQRMHRFLLDYMKDAIPEMLDSSQKEEAFHSWLNNKQDMLENEKLKSTVFHFDVFMTPD
jgi:trans-aconitate methyltransferase